MAIGTLGAIGLGVAGVGSVLGAKAQKKAANKAADTSMQVADENNQLARDIYGQNQAALSPYMQRGNVAGNTMNALLGLGGAPAQPAAQPNVQNFYSGANPAAAPTNALAGFRGGNGQYPAAQAWQGYRQQQVMPTTAAPAAQAGISPQEAANDAFDIFRNSTGYQFRLGEGMNALNSGWAGAGMIQSGAAMRDAMEYGQNFASNEFGNYMGYLGNQQGVGLAGASALAGVGQNYVNTVSNNNNNAGTNIASAALVKGSSNPFANALGTISGSILENVKW